MNVAIIDNYHFEVTYTLISLFTKKENKLTIFVHQEAYQQLLLMLEGEESQYTWIVKEEKQTNRSFVGQIFQHIRQHPFDLLYFNTIEDNFILYATQLRHIKNKKMILTLHDINGFFQYQPSLSIRSLVRYIGKKRLLRSFPSFNVLSETLTRSLQAKLPASKKIFNIPGSYFAPQQFCSRYYKEGDTWEIAVPGAVDIRRRDYVMIFDFLRLARQQNVKVSVTLLGGFSKGNSEEIQQKCQDYLQTNNNLHIYQPAIVDQPEFDRVLTKSHFIWMPLQPTITISDGVKEQYGVSTCSGNIADAIRHASPFFIPSETHIDAMLEKSCTRYKTVNELAAILQHLTENKYSVLQKQAYEASLHYTKENIISRNTAIFL